MSALKKSDFGKQAEPSTPIRGRYVTLEPIAKAHIPSLFRNLGFPENNHITDFITGYPYIYTEDDLAKYIASYVNAHPELCMFAVKACPSQLGPPSASNPDAHTSVLGTCGYRRYPESRTMKWDDLLYSPMFQRSYAATEAHYLLLRIMWETQSTPYNRLWLTVNSQNVKSRTHCERMGYKYEGTFRKDNVTRAGTVKDSDCMSMLSEEWPFNKRVVQRWLSLDNFDSEGQQYKSLQDVRASLTRSTL